MKADALRPRWTPRRAWSGTIAVSIAMAGLVGLAPAPALALALDHQVEDHVLELDKDEVEILDLAEVEFDDGVEIELLDRIEIEVG